MRRINAKQHKLASFLILLFIIVSFISVSTSASPPPVEGMDIPDYDYTHTYRMILYGQGDYVLLGNPFENPAPSMGNLVYEMILLYAAQLQPLAMPSDPTHVLDLMIKDRHNQTRLGQRLFIGDPWLSDGKSVALMKPADYQVLTEMLNKRYDTASRYDIGRIKKVAWPEADSLPEGWLAEHASVREAIQRLPVSDYERTGYDPGAQVRRRINHLPRETSESLDSTIPPVAAELSQETEETLASSVPVINTATSLENLPVIDLQPATSDVQTKPAGSRLFSAALVLLGILILVLTWNRRKTLG